MKTKDQGGLYKQGIRKIASKGDRTDFILFGLPPPPPKPFSESTTETWKLVHMFTVVLLSTISFKIKDYL